MPTEYVVVELAEWAPILIGGLMGYFFRPMALLVVTVILGLIAGYAVATGPTESLALLIPLIIVVTVTKTIVSMWGVSLYANRQKVKPLLAGIKKWIFR